MKHRVSDTMVYIFMVLGNALIYISAIIGIVLLLGSIGALDFATETKSADPVFAWRNAIIGLLMIVPFLIKQFWKEIR